MQNRRIATIMTFVAALALFLAASSTLAGPQERLTADNPNPPATTIKLIFIHHSTGGNWLADPNQDQPYGGLGMALMNNNYFVSATNYEWGPYGIGDRTDIPNWPEWFTGPNSADQEVVVFMVVWEGEDLNVLHHAAQDPTLPSVRWLSAILYPSMISGQFSELSFPEARDFALAHSLWGQEFHPPMNDLVRRLWAQARAELGREPRFEHVYLYDAMQIAARAILVAGTADDGLAVAAAIPTVVEEYDPAMGSIRFDENGDRASGDLAYYGLFQGQGGFEYRYFAFYDAAADRFVVLPEPEPRQIEFCPEC